MKHSYIVLLHIITAAHMYCSEYPVTVKTNGNDNAIEYRYNHNNKIRSFKDDFHSSGIQKMILFIKEMSNQKPKEIPVYQAELTKYAVTYAKKKPERKHTQYDNVYGDRNVNNKHKKLMQEYQNMLQSNKK